ncbi:MAG: hypothetical protein J4415_00585 [Candidatus Diapherotrites archaeon]|uniref:Uncharacterized protein n=1 Tax=Candidatus Iainarchaeum sp. TaxID=3101447 RepID=A0A8T4KZJ0_9ARCH|nr:hypothetical protein [Candidatus Diapherotrites archaeon]
MRRVTAFRKRLAKGEKSTMRTVEKFFFSDIEQAGKHPSFASVMDTEGDVIRKIKYNLKKQKR